MISRSRILENSHSVVIFCDRLTEVLLYAMIVFSLWAFGTTQPWAIRIMNVGGCSLGLIFFIKCVVRRQTRLVTKETEETDKNRPGWLAPLVALLTIMILSYCGVSAWNAYATYTPATWSFDYRTDYIRWLPHSFAGNYTWSIFWNYLALALVFWAIRDWLLTDEERFSSSRLPGRLRRLLWVISLNGALLALEGLIQRLDGTTKLLWLVEPRINKTAEVQFGPYAYRGNGAQYLNLVWPVALGFWWALQNEKKRRNNVHYLLLSFVVLMAACSILSLSRGGAAVSVGCMLISCIIFGIAQRKAGWRVLLGGFLLASLTLLLGIYINWNQLEKRLKTIPTDNLSGRVEIYETANRMTQDYPLFGTGPNTFGSVSQLYRTAADKDWYEQAHDDWLETRVTFGWVGFSLILLALALVLARPFSGGGIPANTVLISFFWVALGGCLIHARFDFPLQIYSILFLFIQLCAILFCLTRSRSKNKSARRSSPSAG